MLAEFFPDVSGFQWDAGNSGKSWERPLVASDARHSAKEPRYFALEQMDAGRTLMVVFTLRDSWLRVIAARPMSRRERKVYGEAKSR